jgi:1-acyl-sn-glycerol-3-phosphate acyltransferase
MIRLAATLRGLAGMTALVVFTLLMGIPLLPAGVVKLMSPQGPLRDRATRAVLAIAKFWARCSNAIILGVGGAHVATEMEMQANPDGRYVLISNHQCWADVMLLIKAIDRQLPFPRYFIKEQLRWLPVVGLACWALDFPFMKRHTRAEIEKNPGLRNEDFNTVRRACKVFHDWPVCIVNYAEGTRSTAAKRSAVESPYRALLPPKAGGTAFAVNAMRDVLDGVVDMSVAYVNTPEPTFWDVLCGRIPTIAIRVRYLPIPLELREGDYTADPEYRERFKIWLSDIWKDKDRAVAALQDRASPAQRFADVDHAATPTSSN